jgi:large subunit ribosomal protein L17
MRHGDKINNLGRTASHRKAMLSNMACSLIKHKKVTTTVAKAKALRVYVEPLITKAKSDSTHNRRTVFSYLRDKEAIKELFGVIAEKVAERPGGYTRILKLGNRMGDNADMAFIELVDFNEFLPAKTASTKKKSTRRGRSKVKSDASDDTKIENTKVETVSEKAETIEDNSVSEIENINDSDASTDSSNDATEIEENKD